MPWTIGLTFSAAPPFLETDYLGFVWGMFCSRTSRGVPQEGGGVPEQYDRPFVGGAPYS